MGLHGGRVRVRVRVGVRVRARVRARPPHHTVAVGHDQLAHCAQAFLELHAVARPRAHLYLQDNVPKQVPRRAERLEHARLIACAQQPRV